MSDLRLSGSCLCGSVAYEISGALIAFYHCHCSRCRKASGTGHASNILLRPDAVQWTAGEKLLQRYKVPEAKRFATVFCSHCGCAMPRVAPDQSVAVVPAGSKPFLTKALAEAWLSGATPPVIERTRGSEPALVTKPPTSSVA